MHLLKYNDPQQVLCIAQCMWFVQVLQVSMYCMARETDDNLIGDIGLPSIYMGSMLPSNAVLSLRTACPTLSDG